MRVVSDEALLLEVGELSDPDRLVVFLSRKHGLKRGAARGARRRYSRFAGQLQPLAKAHVTWMEKPDRDLARVRAVELVRPAHKLQETLEDLLVGFYLADHARVFAAPDEPNEALYRLLDSTLEALLAGAPRDLACRYVETWTLRLTGIFPAPRECLGCGDDLAAGAVLPRGGEGLVCPRCAGATAGLSVPPEAIALLRRFGAESLAQLAADPPSATVLARLEAVAGEIRRGFLQHELKSYQVMQRARQEG